MAITHASTLHGSDAGGGDVALLCSGGIDSIVLAADLASGLGAGARLHPLYVRSGLSWEQGELEVVARALAALPHRDSIRPLVTLDVPIGDLYPPDHWALTGQPPAYDTPDEDVYLVGRNVTLLAKAAVHCALHGVTRLCMAPLAGNPFPDATPEFFATMGAALSLGLRAPLRIDAPYRELSKVDVIRRGHRLGVPFELTVSCMRPEQGRHCGRCSKCRERHEAFVEALGSDPTEYGVMLRD